MIPPRRVNLRANLSSVHGDDESRDKAEFAAEAARVAQAARGVRFAVAPGCVVTTPSGVVLPEGTELGAALLHGHPHHAGWSLLEQHVIAGRVLEADLP